eukprot:scaffold6486_cov96-Cylindrotheca_fusiformis.AAC.10
MLIEEIQGRLKDSVGIHVSSEWLEACISFLQREHQQQSITADQCMFQVLHSDLRDVVDQQQRTSLQALIQQSKAEQQPRQETPSDFQLLVQLEEAYDVTLGREQRFNPQHSNKTAYRCLKLCLSSGYVCNSSSPIVAQEVQRIPHLQSNSLAGLKILLRGKIVIRRGILQLHGGNAHVLGGNVPELVRLQQQAIEKAQKEAGVGIDPTLRALIQDDNDNNDGDEENQPPEDEAHEQSRDAPVVPHPTTATIPAAGAPLVPLREMPPPPPQNSLQVRQPMTTTTTSSTGRTPPPSTGNSPTPNTIMANPSAGTARPSRTNTPIVGGNSQNPYATARTSLTPPNVTNPARPATATAANPYANSNNNNNSTGQASITTATTSLSPTISIVSPRPTISTANPYANNNNNIGQTSTMTTTTMTSLSRTTSNVSPRPAITPANPYASAGQRSASTTNRPPSAIPLSGTRTAAPPLVQRNPYQSSSSNNNTTRQSLSEPTRDSNTASSHTTTTPVRPSVLPITNGTIATSTTPTTASTTTPNSAASSLTANSSTTILPQSMAFGNLYTLLGQLVQNRQLFETYSKVVFQVAMRQCTDNIHFNIVKNPKYNKRNQSKDSKYIFLINATFGTHTNDPRLVACKLPPAWIATYFAKSATELRALTKTNRAECDRLVQRGGDRVKAELFQRNNENCQLWKVTLCPTVDEVFATEGPTTAGVFPLDDTKRPILQLQKE